MGLQFMQECKNDRANADSPRWNACGTMPRKRHGQMARREDQEPIGEGDLNRAEVQISENAAAAPLRKSSVHVVTAITAIFLLIASVLACVLGSIAVTNSVRARGNRDFVEYWAAGAQLVHHQNPYDIPSDLRLERSAGADFSSPLVIFNPPFILPLLAPLGLMSAKAASQFWLTLKSGRARCIALADLANKW